MTNQSPTASVLIKESESIINEFRSDSIKLVMEPARSSFESIFRDPWSRFPSSDDFIIAATVKLDIELQSLKLDPCKDMSQGEKLSGESRWKVKVQYWEWCICPRENGDPREEVFIVIFPREVYCTSPFSLEKSTRVGTVHRYFP